MACFIVISHDTAHPTELYTQRHDGPETHVSDELADTVLALYFTSISEKFNHSIRKNIINDVLDITIDYEYDDSEQTLTIRVEMI